MKMESRLALRDNRWSVRFGAGLASVSRLAINDMKDQQAKQARSGE